MSDIRKWMKIIESVPPTLLNQIPKTVVIKKDATVMMAPHIGGGTGRYMHSTPQGAMIDIKGAAREFNDEDFSLPNNDYEDPYTNGNSWLHATEEESTIGSMNDKPEFRSGDMVKIEDVYGTTIGPGIGVFIAYSTSGQESIISFDNKEIVVPTSSVSAILEQNAKDNFNQTDNDGNLSPMSFGSSNVKIEQGPAMDHRDEFSKWVSAVEEALSSENKELAEDMTVGNECGCGSWNCPVCFPAEDNTSSMNGSICNDTPNSVIVIGGVDMAEPDTCPTCGHDSREDHDQMQCDLDTSINDIQSDETSNLEEVGMFDEEEEDFMQVEKPRSGMGVKLGDIVTKTEFRKTGGQNSPLTYGEDNLDEEEFNGIDANDNELDNNAGHINNMQRNNETDIHQDDDSSQLISSIMYMQDMGLSKADTPYAEDQLNQLPADQLEQCYDSVMGTVSENSKPKPTTTRNYLDDLDDMLGPQQSHPLTNMGPDDDNDAALNGPMSLPASSKKATQDKLRKMTPSDTMRNYMSRIDPLAGEDESPLPDLPQTDLIVKTASDVPAVISSAMQATGMQTPEWHTVNNLPGYSDDNIRGMGRKVFGMFTSTPLEQVQTVANVGGQGPNTDAEMRAVAGWLRDNADDLGVVDIDFGKAISGYKPEVKEYSLNGVRFQVVRDPMGQYIYAYPDKDARLNGMTGTGSKHISKKGNTPRIGESASLLSIKPSLFEQIKWDQELEEAFIEESSLSKLIGNEKGGQKLVQWLHRKHKLGNMADLQPQPFNERMMWKEFKRNPDNFVIVAATNGVAGIKPYEKQIRDRMEVARQKRRDYDPGGDSTLQYQIIAFTDDGQQVDPALLQPATVPGEGKEVDPTVMKARMGKINGKDMQNPDNVFNLLAEQIGSLQTVYLATGAVERDKMKGRADMKAEPAFDEDAAVQKIFNKVRPVLTTLANQALGQLRNTARRYMDGGNEEGAADVMTRAKKVKEFLATIDTSGDINLGANWNFRRQILKAVEGASGTYRGSPDYDYFLKTAAAGNSSALKPVLDALRDNLVSLT